MENKWFKRPHPNPQAQMRLFCLPHAGGGTSAFYGWADQFSSQIELSLLQLPGRESRLIEEPIGSMPALVAAVVDAMVPLLDRPFALFGHSLGALISFELVRELRRRDLPEPLHLFVAGCRAPHIVVTHRNLHQLPEPQLITYLAQEQVVPEPVLQEPKLVSYLLPGLRADFSLFETYRYQPAQLLECPITAYGGVDDHSVSHAELHAWRLQTAHAFHLHTVPGSHFFLKKARPQIIETVQNSLAYAAMQNHQTSPWKHESTYLPTYSQPIVHRHRKTVPATFAA